MVIETQFNINWIILSIFGAIFASYVALNMAQSITQNHGRTRTKWLASGTLAMGLGIWSMHFIGMASMRTAAEIHWNFYLVLLSILVALVASFGALFIRLRNKADHFQKLLFAGTVMGFGISGMHYIGMMAATYIYKESSGIENSNLLVSSGLAVTVLAATLVILGLALVSSRGQRLLSTKTKEADKILGQSEEKFRRLVEAVKDYAIFMLDTEGNITTWNLGAKRITGYTDAETVGKHISIFYTQNDIDNRIAEKELIVAKELGHFEGEGRRVRKDGSMYWASVVITPLYDAEGIITGFSKVTRDVTRVKEADARMRHLHSELEERVAARTRALEERENQLRNITDAVPVLIAQLNKNEQILFANEAFRKWFLLGNEAVNRKPFRDVLGTDRYLANRPYIEKALNGEVVTYEIESESEDVKANFAITLVPEKDEKTGAVTGFIILASDITKHKEIQAELERAKEAAEVANATKSAFLANMSHEIRTPLGAVLGFSELLLGDDMTSSERVNSFEIIKRNGRLLSNIINDILDLSKVEAGRLDVEKLDVSFADIMKEVSSVLSLEASEKGIGLTVTSVGALPDHIKTDPLRLRQILFNIVGNAIKFTNRGSVNVRVKLISDSESATKLAFIVTDTGEGISPDQVSRLFRPFSQADVSTTRKFGGTGLGLILSKKLANVLGGDVVLTDSTLGKGSVFTVTIDPGFSEQILFKDAEVPVTNTWQLSQWRPNVNLSSLKILLVDDSIDNQILIKKILKLAGAEVETASNGKEAVEKALNGNFSVILMDLQMPEMDGYEATRVLRSKGFNKPIIALTAHAMEADRRRSLESGFDSHLTKPIDNVALVRALAEYSA